MAPIARLTAAAEPSAQRPARGGAALRQGSSLALRGERASVAAAYGEPPALDPAQSGDAALRQIGLAGLDNIVRNEAAVLAGLDQGIHQMRVSVRRLRAALSAFRELLPEHQRRWASAELRWLADALGPARNLDVFEATLLKPVSDNPDTLALKTLRRAVQRQRRAAYRDAARAVRSARYAELMLNLSRWFETCGWRIGDHAARLEQPIGIISRHALQHRWRAAKRRSKGFAAQSSGQRHRLRIALKKLRYNAEALAVLYHRDDADRFIRRVKRLQDGLGHANDLCVGHDILAGLFPAPAADDRPAEIGKQLLDGHEARLAKREPKLRKHLHQLFETEPFWRD
ncbi:MAG: CHAD domain-containing protein [Alphaproteobacteria bacterium]|nr:CHAD domain-containing protein [Alphaproteobacteria bacterium]MBV9584486.1 CHAD domain-containing protein [Alphaproteobacteria bacterium]